MTLDQRRNVVGFLMSLTFKLCSTTSVLSQYFVVKYHLVELVYKCCFKFLVSSNEKYKKKTWTILNTFYWRKRLTFVPKITLDSVATDKLKTMDF